MNLDYNYVLAYATEKHKGQFRHDGVTPYIEHPKRVAELVKQYKQSKNIEAIVAAALLHDTLEDTYTSYRELKEEFGEMVASMVMEVTSAQLVPSLMGKGRYLKHKMKWMSPYALVIKLCDRLANLQDCASLPKDRQEHLKQDTAEIIAFLKESQNLTEVHKTLIRVIEDELKK